MTTLGREPVSISPLGQGPVVAQLEIRSYAKQGPVIEGTCKLGCYLLGSSLEIYCLEKKCVGPTIRQIYLYR